VNRQNTDCSITLMHGKQKQQQSLSLQTLISLVAD